MRMYSHEFVCGTRRLRNEPMGVRPLPEERPTARAAAVLHRAFWSLRARRDALRDENGRR